MSSALDLWPRCVAQTQSRNSLSGGNFGGRDFDIASMQRTYRAGQDRWNNAQQGDGIDIHVAAKKPEGLPAENRLPIIRNDEHVDVIMRISAPDVPTMNKWTVPKVE